MDRIFDIQGFDGGEGDSLYKGPANSFFAGENIEIRKNTSGVELSPKLTDTGRTISDEILCMVDLTTLGVSSGGVVVCAYDGNVYLNGTLKFTLNSATSAYNRIIGIGVNEVSGTQYVYLFTQSSSTTAQIHRCPTNMSGATTNHITYTVSGSTQAQTIIIINNAGLLYVSRGNGVWILDNTEVMTNYLTLPPLEQIVGFTQYLGDFKIYSNYSTTGVQYIWDGASNAVSYRQEWKNQPILGVTNDGSSDYAILGFNKYYSDLYIIQGTQKTELRVNLENSSSSRILDGFLSIREGIIYISGGLSGGSTKYGIYTYGNYYPGMPKSLVQSYSGTTNLFDFHCHTITSSYFSEHSTDKVYTISHNNPPSTYADDGYIITQIYQGIFWEDKDFTLLKIGLKLNGGQVDIYVRTDIDGSWVLLKSITYALYGTQKRVKIAKDEVLSLGLGTFNEIQFKFLLTCNTAKTQSPVISRVTTYLKTVND